ncbi:MAG TPA: hypothetical protein VN969_25305 [Streptosporangiaceae bacterium]|jgi:hypothetical protein|nr:hypothetical protein [Streptosporangiaceae bacterium]
MTRKLARTGIAAIVLASIAIAGSALPANAKPAINANTEYMFLYWSTPEHTTLNGYYEFGCSGTVTSGKLTGYMTEETAECYPPD